MEASEFQILREDIAGMRKEFNERLDKLVSREMFALEQRRVDDRFTQMGIELADARKDNSELESALKLETQARLDSETAALNAQIAESKAREKLGAQTRWQWFTLAASGLIFPLIGGAIGYFFAAAQTALGVVQ